MGAAKSWDCLDTLCCVGYLLQAGLSCEGTVWGTGSLRYGDTDRFIPGLLFSGDRQDGEDKTSHELLALRYLLPGRSGGICTARAPWAGLSLLSGWGSRVLQVGVLGLPLLPLWVWHPGLPRGMGGKLGCRAGASTAAPVMAHPRRLSRELQEKEKVIKSLEAKLQERCESPGSSRPPSESSRSATSASFVSDALEPCSDGDAASECSQCHEEPTQLAGTTGCHDHGLGTCSTQIPAVVGTCVAQHLCGSAPQGGQDPPD